jgi:serine protease
MRETVLRLLTIAAAACVLVAIIGIPDAAAAPYVPGEVVVGFTSGPVATLASAAVKRMAVRTVAGPAGEQVIKLPSGTSVKAAIARLRRQRGVTYAVPNYIAHEAGSWIPNDTGRSHVPGGWQSLQWNFSASAGVNAPGAWANMFAAGRPGGRGAVVAILDTGIAYRSWRAFRKSPDFTGTRFVHPYDFVDHNAFPLDRVGHGTFVAGEVAEATNDHYALTGLAYGASIMPVRILDATGQGDSATIARGIRYAARHGAQVINLSLQFDPSTTAANIPGIIGAIAFANRHGAVVVGASGNDAVNEIAYPARAPTVISVGATTRDRCLATYSNGGPGLDIVAPGGGDDAGVAGDLNCHPGSHQPSISQLTLTDPPHWGRFGYPRDVYGTSMSAPLVSATAALVIASGVLGPHPTPEQIKARLEHTAQPLGAGQPNDDYGWGLLDAAAATSPAVTAR